MFEGMPRSERTRQNGGMAASFAVHVAFLLFLLHHTAPLFVTPWDVDLGIPHSSGSRSIVYLAPIGPERSQPVPQEQAKLALHRLVAKQAPPRKIEARREQPAMTAANAPDETARGGSLYGRIPGSPLTGDEIVPAFPEVYPDPPVSRDDIPNGVQGDVIVEVTIDSQGNVAEMKLLKGIGYGVEQKVLDVLQRWHFHPAMRDGVTIASQHIVHFHYPG